MPLRADLLLPIAPDNPAGVPLLNEPVYEEIKEARREDDSGARRDDDPPPRKADWPKVLKLASDAIATRSKDLDLATWIVEALVRLEGLAGLRDGVLLVRSLVDGFWNTLYPAIDPQDDDPFGARVGRLNRIAGAGVVLSLQSVPLTMAGYGLTEWEESHKVGSESDARGDPQKLAARQKRIDAGEMPAEKFFAAVDETPKAWYRALLAQLRELSALVTSLEARCSELMPDVPPSEAVSFVDLREVLGRLERVASELLDRRLKSEPDTLELTGDGASAQHGGNGVAPSAKANGAADVPIQTLDDATTRLIALARYLRRTAPGDPGPYLMLRGLRWGELRRGGGALDPELLAAPPTAARANIKGLAIAERWSEVLEACEDLMARPEGRAWLDLQRFAVRACEHVGGDFEAVGRAILGELALLLRDRPALPRLTLMDETPTASAETLAWLAHHDMLPAAESLGIGAAAPTAPVTSASPLVVREGRAADPAFDRAMELTTSGQPRRALEVLTRELSRERSARARFLRQAQMATVMVEAGLDALARPTLDDLLGTINAKQLDAWEAGELVAQPLALLFRVLKRLDAEEDVRQDVYLRICRLDPLQALALEA